MKGFFFTMDVLIALIIIALTVPFILVIFSTSTTSEDIEARLYAEAEQTIDFISNVKVSTVMREPVITDLFEQGMLGEEDADKTLLEIMGELWAENTTESLDAVRNITEKIILNSVPANVNFGVRIDDELVYNTSEAAPSRAVSVSKRIASGFTKGAPSSGFIVKAFLKSIKAKRTASFAFFDGFVGEGTISVGMSDIPRDAVINSVYVELNAGDDFDILINETSCSNGAGFTGNGTVNVTHLIITDPSCIAQIDPGNETIFKITFNTTKISKKFIGGGFIKVVYDTSEINKDESDTIVYNFPGIENGIINLFGGFYTPGNITAMKTHMHYINNYTTFMTIGNVTIFSNASNNQDEQNFSIMNDTIGSLLNYPELSRKTVPLRLGTTDFPKSSLGQSDSILITDLSWSMLNCDINVPCGTGTCGGPSKCKKKRLEAAKESDADFAEVILNRTNPTNNRLGTTTFATTVCETLDLTSNLSHVLNETESYRRCGSSTCISCGIQQAMIMLNKTVFLRRGEEWFFNDSFNASTPPDMSGIKWYEPEYPDQNWSVNRTPYAIYKYGNRMNVSVNIESPTSNNHKYPNRLSPPDSGVWTVNGLGDQMRLHFYDNWKGQNTGIRTEKDYDYLWITDIDDNTVVMPGWENNEFPNRIDSNDHISDYWSEWGNGNVMKVNLRTDRRNRFYGFRVDKYEYQTRANTIYGNYYFRKNFTLGPFDIPEVAKMSVRADDRAEIYLNGQLVYNSTTDLAGAYWNVNDVNLSPTLFEIGDNVVAAKIMNDDDDDAQFDVEIFGRNQRIKAMLVMSDGKANDCIGSKCIGGNADYETVAVACDAFTNHSIRIFAVAFGIGADKDTLNQTANCDDSSHFYTSDNLDDLKDIYREIAERIINITIENQTIEAINILPETLFNDSYIAINITRDITPSAFREISMQRDTDPFGWCNGSYVIPENLTVEDIKATSYSFNLWTHNVSVKSYTTGNEWHDVYTLSDYGNKYLEFGDPFFVQFDPDYTWNGTNFINVSLATNSTNISTLCSQDNRVIYNAKLKTSVVISDLLPELSGSNVTVYFDKNLDNTPDGYVTLALGKNLPTFDPTPKDVDALNPQNALDDALIKLMGTLNFISSGTGLPGTATNPIDIEPADDIEIEISPLTDIPFIWGPIDISVEVWK